MRIHALYRRLNGGLLAIGQVAPQELAKAHPSVTGARLAACSDEFSENLRLRT